MSLRVCALDCADELVTSTLVDISDESAIGVSSKVPLDEGSSIVLKSESGTVKVPPVATDNKDVESKKTLDASKLASNVLKD